MNPLLVYQGLSDPMKKRLLTLGLLFVLAASVAAQSSAEQSVKAVLQRYRKMDADGERLTPRGWYKASAFFIKPSPPPQHYVVTVMPGEIVGKPLVTGNRAEVWVEYYAEGRIDSSARFERTLAPTLKGPIPSRQQYYLLLTDSHWEFGRNGEATKEVKGPPEWRIETFESEPRIMIETAIRYLTQLRNKSSDPVIRKNAARSIAALRRLR